MYSSLADTADPLPARLLAFIQPQPTWRVLNITTDDRQAALVCAPYVAEVVEVRLDSAEFLPLPYAPAAFDLVISRLAAHHFPDIAACLDEIARVLRPRGWCGLIDNLAPADEKAADYLNAFERLRDPTHRRCLSLDEWRRQLYSAGLELQEQVSQAVELDFEAWISRQPVQPLNRLRLRAMLLQAPRAAQAHLTPHQLGDRIAFHLQRGLLISRRPDPP